MIRMEKDSRSRENQPRNAAGLTEEEFLARYEPGKYERPSLTVDMLLFTIDEGELKLLLVKRKDHPYIGCWAFPGGFVGINESIEEAMYRELKEETNVDRVYMEQLYTWGDVDRDPRMRVVSVSYLALAPKTALKPSAGDDAAEVAWFIVKKQPLLDYDGQGLKNEAYLRSLTSEDGAVKIAYIVTERQRKNGVLNIVETHLELFPGTAQRLAFDHQKAVNLALERLKNKVNYTPIAFNLMPEEFTLGQLQKVYETLLGKTLYKANFRKKIFPMVIETEKKTENVKHRPSQFYRFNPDYKED